MPAEIRPAKVALIGASGRMGQRILEALRASDDFTLHCAIVSSGSTALTTEVPGFAPLKYESNLGLLKGAACVIDFSLPEATAAVAEAAGEANLPLLIGTTGLDPSVVTSVREYAQRIPILLAPNTSLGVSIVARLVAQARAAAGEAFEFRVLDLHHGAKRDAPSGTARFLAAASGVGSEQNSTNVPQIASIRGGDVVGDHTVFMLGDGERIEIVHRAHDRSVFARGALALMSRLRAKPPGLYDPTTIW